MCAAVGPRKDGAYGVDSGAECVYTYGEFKVQSTKCRVNGGSIDILIEQLGVCALNFELCTLNFFLPSA